MDEGLIAVLINNKVDYSWKHSIPSDDLGDDELAHAVTLLVPLSGKRFLLGIGRHIPFLPLFGIVDKGPDNIGEIWQFFKVTDGVPVRWLYPVVWIDWLCLSIDV
jgi:hypothetical protein